MVLAAMLGGCPSGTGNNGATPTPTTSASPTTACSFSADQTGGLSLDCTITGPLANSVFDPLNPSNTSCTPMDISDAGLLTLSSQTVSVPVTMIYGANNDDGPGRVRVDVNLGTSTHNAMLGKTMPDCGVPPVNVAVMTTFSGMHSALVDKDADPMCVARSTYTPASFSQTIGSGGPDAAIATQSATEAAIARILDLRVATAVNDLINQGADLTGGFQTRSGRCAEGYGPFNE